MRQQGHAIPGAKRGRLTTRSRIDSSKVIAGKVDTRVG